MSNNILQPVSPDLNTYLRENAQVFLNSTTPAAPSGDLLAKVQMDQFGNISLAIPIGAGAGAVGSAGQIQMVSGTPGVFAASSLTDNGTTVSTAENIVSTNGVLEGQFVYAANANVGIGFSSPYDNTYQSTLFFGGGSPGANTLGNLVGLGTNVGNGDNNLYIHARAGSAAIYRFGSTTNAASITSTLATLPAIALTASTTATSATAGAATALPVAPLGYLEVVIAGTTVKIPYYSI